MPDDGYPATSASGIKLKDLSHQRCLDALVARMDYAGPARGAGAAARAGHPPRHRHRHLHQGHGAGPARLLRHRRRADLLQDACVIKLEPNGGVICAVGVTEQGQGIDTVMGQIAATALGVPMDSVRVLSGDTDATPFGGGTYRLARHRHRRRGGVPGRARPAPGNPGARRRAAAGRARRARHRRRHDRRSQRRPAAPAARRDRPHRPLPGRRAAQQRAARSSRTRAASAWSTTSTSSPTASTAPTSRSTPTPASSAC